MAFIAIKNVSTAGGFKIGRVAIGKPMIDSPVERRHPAAGLSP
jgi:hypothetical protein